MKAALRRVIGWELVVLRFLLWILLAVVVPFAIVIVGADAIGLVSRQTVVYYLLLASAASLGTLVFGAFVLPRRAHAAFEAGRIAVAARRYAVLQWISVRGGRARSALLSRIGCCVAGGKLERAERMLAALDEDALDASERAVWLNNRACAALAAGGDAHAALALADEAGALRPDVPALQHTRGMALLAVGRVDDAIAVLDGMRAGGELSARLEADRCRDLAKAWRAKGETAYAEDYQLRADGYRGG